MDVAARHGTQIDAVRLSEAIDVPVLKLIAARNVGVEELVQATISAASDAHLPVDLPALPLQLEQARAGLERLIAPHLPEAYPLHWAALKVLEQDRALIEQLRGALNPIEQSQLDRILQANAGAAIAIAGDAS